MPSDNVLISVISVAGGAITAYIAARFRKKKPKSEYIDTAVSMYENIIKRQDAEMKKKDDLIESLQTQLKEKK